MVAEVLEHLAPSRGGVFVDCTVGLGGHARALVGAGASRVIGLDRDQHALAHARETLRDTGSAIDVVHADYRGFEDVLRTYAHVKRDLPAARLMIIGHGEHRPALEALARELNVDPIWAGYHEDDLAEHYRAADILLFTARGSDEGHRAVLEAMACGIAPVTFPIEGVAALLGDLAPRLIAEESSPESAAEKVIAASNDLANLRRSAYEQSQNFGYAQAAARLIDVYEG